MLNFRIISSTKEENIEMYRKKHPRKRKRMQIAAKTVKFWAFLNVWLSCMSLSHSWTQFKCCGSHNYTDWTENVWLEQNQLLVPDSCCKTRTALCGARDHPSNIYKLEVGRPQHVGWEVRKIIDTEADLRFRPVIVRSQGGCIMKLEEFILSQLYILGAVGIGVACLQVIKK